MNSALHRVGIDIGGTFTDFSLWRADQERFVTLKVPTTRAQPATGVLQGLKRLAAEENFPLSDIGYVVHGTTIALNTLIERDGARLGLLVTRGFRDLLTIQRLRMPTPYNWRTGRPEPLLQRRCVFEVTERLGPDGSVETPFDAGDVETAVREARSAALNGLVVCFLHAYRNPAHERMARERIAAIAPDLFVCCSHEVWPRMREYERALISIVNAYVMPQVDAYLDELGHQLREEGLTTSPCITQSTGGVVSVASARNRPIETLLSGPAAGVMGAIHTATAAGIADFITLDIGGTSTDVAFVDGGRPRISQSEHVAEFPLLMPVIGVSSIGAGGGSIVSADASGVLRVGPTSAGADPGPACYGRGGGRPTVTDAFLIGGFLNPDNFAGGRMKLSMKAARAALSPISAALERDEAATVDAIIQVAVSSIYAELSNLAAKQGVSLRDYALLPFGGAGPLLATRVAEELGMDRILVPEAPGTLCSLGALFADVSKPFVRSIALPADRAADALKAAFATLSAEADAWLRNEASHLSAQRFEVAADMRYLGQSYEIDVELKAEWVKEGALEPIVAAFHRRHQAMFAHADASAPVEIMDLRLMVIGATSKPFSAARMQPPARRRPAKRDQRSVAIDGTFRPVPVMRRADLAQLQSLRGPAIIEQDDTTTYVAPNWAATAHASGALIIERCR